MFWLFQKKKRSNIFLKLTTLLVQANRFSLAKILFKNEITRTYSLLVQNIIKCQQISKYPHKTESFVTAEADITHIWLQGLYSYICIYVYIYTAIYDTDVICWKRGRLSFYAEIHIVIGFWVPVNQKHGLKRKVKVK